MRGVRLVPLLVAAMGCGRGTDLTTHEGVTDAHIKAMEELADLLDGIKDKWSAEAARPDMEAIGRRIQEINAAEEKLKPPESAEKQRLDAKLEDAAKRLEPRFEKTMERLKGDPETVVLVARMMAEATFGSGR